MIVLPIFIVGLIIALQDFSAYEGLISSPGDMLLDYMENRDNP